MPTIKCICCRHIFRQVVVFAVILCYIASVGHGQPANTRRSRQFTRPRQPVFSRGPRQPAIPRETRQPVNSRDSRQPVNSRGSRQPVNSRESRQPVNPRGPRQPPISREPKYPYHKVLDDSGQYELWWRFNDTIIEFEVKVQTLGYVGFGLSKEGQMFDSDIVIGWVEKNEFIYFGDYHTKSTERKPSMDASQDWFLQDATEADGFTVLRFYRKLITCDVNDHDITRDTMTVIYAFHDQDPVISSGMVPYHGVTKRGSRNILLLESGSPPISFPPPGTFVIDFRNHMHPIAPVGSSLVCVVFNMQGLLPKSHVIKYEPLLEAGHEPYVYRMILYSCSHNNQSLDGRRFECLTEAPAAVKTCKATVATWAMGAEAFHFPDDIGLSLGSPDDATMFVLEIHYTNFNLTQGVIDSSGLRITYTTSLRKHEAGMLELGNVLTPGWRQFIPHGERRFSVSSYCSPRCMNWGFSTDRTSIKVIGAVLHGNDIATEMKVRHFRGYRELPWVVRDQDFSNFYQEARIFPRPVSVDAWDTLAVQCTYDSSNREGITRGGYSRIEEMCRATLIYYPRKALDVCLGWSSFDTLVTPTGIRIPEGGAMDYFGNITQWDARTTRTLKMALHQSTERSLCSTHRRRSAYAIDRYRKPRISLPYTDRPTNCPH